MLSLTRSMTTLSKRNGHDLLRDIYKLVLDQRFKDIVVIKTDFDISPQYILLASSFSTKHLVRGTESVNINYKRTIKSSADGFARISISESWNVLDFEQVTVHLFEKKCRDYFDIEQLWAVGERYDALTQEKLRDDNLASYKFFLDKIIKEQQDSQEISDSSKL